MAIVRCKAWETTGTTFDRPEHLQCNDQILRIAIAVRAWLDGIACRVQRGGLLRTVLERILREVQAMEKRLNEITGMIVD